jgi:Mrp family chromosome partitioning ATPase
VLRTNLQFADVDKPGHSIVVTSATQSEGRTTTAVNLAVSFAEAGRRVILVDGHLRRPSVHRYFGLESQRGGGLTSLFVGDYQKSDLDQCCQSGPIANLSIVTSGAPCRPTRPSFSRPIGRSKSCGLFRAEPTS